jgi:hypothetical protein
MTDAGFDLGVAGAEKVTIRLRAAGGQIDGVVRGTDDNPAPGVTVALIPASNNYLLYNSTFSDQKGVFTFKGVKPGDYKLLAWEQIEVNAFMDPEFVKPFLGRAESVSMKENDRKAVTLKVIARQ